MTADEKIKEAEFFLQKIIENYEKSPFVEYYFHAFLTSTRSISDYLLEDYNKKYNFNITDHEEDFRKKFKDKCYETGGQPMEFDKWHDRQITKITSDNIGSDMWRKRNLTTHRSGEKLDNLSQIIFGGDFPKDKAIAIDSHNGKPIRFLPTTVISIEGMAFVDLKEACEKFISLMREMVSEAHRKFP